MSVGLSRIKVPLVTTSQEENAPRKLAERVAMLLEQQILAKGYQPGYSLGTELELAKDFGVSRWIMREAIAITDRDGLTVMLRGRHGGLIVGESLDQTLTAALCQYLLFTRMDENELLQVREVIDRVVYLLAANHIRDEFIDEAQNLLDLPLDDPLEYTIALYELILKFADNAFVAIFGSALYKLTLCRGIMAELWGLGSPEQADLAGKMLDIRRQQLTCIMACDSGGSMEAATAAHHAWRQLFAQLPVKARSGSVAARSRHVEQMARNIAAVVHPGKLLKRSALLSTQIATDILRDDLMAGDLIASEVELMGHYQVGRPVLREALRMLERDGFVRTEVGRNGGIVVGLPSSRTLVERTVNFLRLLDIRTEHMDLLWREMAGLTVQLAAQRIGDAGKGLLDEVHATLAPEMKSSSLDLCHHLHSLFEVLARITRNPILILFFSITQRLVPPGLTADDVDHALADQVRGRLLDALKNGDQILSRRCVAQLIALHPLRLE